jgi:hypothetical protein
MTANYTIPTFIYFNNVIINIRDIVKIYKIQKDTEIPKEGVLNELIGAKYFKPNYGIRVELRENSDETEYFGTDMTERDVRFDDLKYKLTLE